MTRRSAIFKGLSERLSIGGEFLRLPSGRLPNVYQSTNLKLDRNTQTEQYRNQLIPKPDTLTNTAANLPPRANCVHDCRKLSTSVNYHCSHGASSVSTVQWSQCTEHSGPSGESRSEMSKTAVLIVSLTWKLGRRGPLVESGQCK